MKVSLTRAEARRIALAAQGFTGKKPSGRVDARHYDRLLRHVKLLQLDSVNVAVRAHYMPAFSRLGPYPSEQLDDYAYRKSRLFEGWGHMASLLPMDHYPLLSHRMERARPWPRLEGLIKEQRAYIDSVRDQVAARGPLTVSDLDDGGDRNGPWWGLSRGKIALEWLFHNGSLAATRRGNFTRVYDLADRVIPPGVLNMQALSKTEAQREMLRLAAEAHGVGTLTDLADYYRIKVPEARPRLSELIEEGVLKEVSVEGWPQTAYMNKDARLPRRANATAIVSPFDSLVWYRDRTERLFDFLYRIEIYVPKPKRQYGYYVYPFLHNGELVARVDLKADRSNGVLLVQAAYLEKGRDAGEVAPALASELTSMAEWLGLRHVAAKPSGDLAGALGQALD
ncbi:MAG: YcaQ family DNA glycosylase [Alphaproteobacteria bacterium]|nr:YcaQ family DNA glycosylase [Alphaproteobacteria bacterium]